MAIITEELFRAILAMDSYNRDDNLQKAFNYFTLRHPFLDLPQTAFRHSL